MQHVWFQRLLALLFVMMVPCGICTAHETSMGIIEFREVRPGSYVGGWTL